MELITMNNKKQRILSVSCGIITSALVFYLIPRFFMKGINDTVWILLMLLLPTIAAVVLLYVVSKCSPKSVFWSLLVECAVAFVLHKSIGEFLGYQLDSFAWDFFDFIAYFIFAFGWAIAVTLTQFIVLLAINKYKQK